MIRPRQAKLDYCGPPGSGKVFELGNSGKLPECIELKEVITDVHGGNKCFLYNRGERGKVG